MNKYVNVYNSLAVSCVSAAAFALSMIQLVARAALASILGAAHAVALPAAAGRCIVDRADAAATIVQSAPVRVRGRIAAECGRSAVLVDCAHETGNTWTEKEDNRNA